MPFGRFEPHQVQPENIRRAKHLSLRTRIMSFETPFTLAHTLDALISMIRAITKCSREICHALCRALPSKNSVSGVHAHSNRHLAAKVRNGVLRLKAAIRFPLSSPLVYYVSYLVANRGLPQRSRHLDEALSIII